MSSARRVVVVGLDSITPVMVDRFLAEGRMPHLARLRERGWWTETVPTMPPTTTAGWTTVATGAWPSTHGIEGFAAHRPGDPLDRKVHTLTSDHVRAEQLWKVAEREGLDTILLKYPVSWPPTGGRRVIQVDGAAGWGGLKCVWDLVHSGSWDTHPGASRAPEEEVVGPQDWMTRDADNLDEEATRPITPAPAGEWTGLPAGFRPAWSAVLELEARQGGRAGVRLLAGRLGEVECVILAGGPGAAGAAAVAPGQWSQWLPLEFATPGGPRRGSVRFRVMALDLEGHRLTLYQSQVHDEEGFTSPPDLAPELVRRLGPFVEWTESYDLLQGWIDHDTQLELYERHIEWMSGAARLLLHERPWHLFLTQVHVVDMAYHIYWGAVDPRHPDHRPEDAARFWDLLGRVHELADAFLGAIVEEAGDDTLVVALGDHGHDVYHTALLTNHALFHAGLLALRRNPASGRTDVDWPRTQAFASSYRVYCNLRGREPNGMVEPADLPAAQQRIVDALTLVTDPTTGQRVVRLALPVEDAAGLGLGGPTMGDVVFALAPGYQARSGIQLPRTAWVGGRVSAGQVPVLARSRLFREFTGDHDTSLPHSRPIRTLLHLAGPGVARGRRRTPVDLVDVCPTICHWLGLPLPADCEGKPVLDAFVRTHAAVDAAR